MASFGFGGASANRQQQQEIDSSTPWMAASEGNLSLLQSSLSFLQLPVAAADENGYTLLHAAASYNQLPIIHYLLQNHVDINAVDNDGDSVLHHVGNLETAKLLIEVGKANPSIVNKQGKTALQAKQEELDEMMSDEDVEDDDEDLETLKVVVGYFSTLLR